MGSAPMTESEKHRRHVRTTAFLTFGLVAALVFGTFVLLSGDWIPGLVTVVAALAGLAQQVPVVRRLRSERSPSPPGHKPAH